MFNQLLIVGVCSNFCQLPDRYIIIATEGLTNRKVTLNLAAVSGGVLRARCAETREPLHITARAHLSCTNG